MTQYAERAGYMPVYKLYEELAAWAEEDFRSVNGQIEYLLTACVRQRKKNGRPVPEDFEQKEE